jgi:3-hydroxybutyrate dehydrogenase
LVQKQIDAKAQQLDLSHEESTRQLLAEKQPSMQFVSPEQISDLVVYLCSPAADNIRGVAWNIDGGWFAQ